MTSLRDLADRALQRSKHDGTADGTSLEQVEQGKSLFHVPHLVPRGVEQDMRQKTAINKPCSTVPFPRGGTDGTSDLAKPVQRGVNSLRRSPCPRGVDPKAWRTAVASAVHLSSDGWAAKALALGWSELDLFGAVPDRDGDPYADGLAVKLGGRTILALCETFATVSSGGAGRAFLHRGNNDGAVLLWALGRGR